jgi:hypothetical protein
LQTVPGSVRCLLLGVVLILSIAGPVRADAGLTGAVAAAYFPRAVDDGLHEIAHQRVAELLACRCLEHDLMRPGTAEVLYTGTRGSNSVQSAIAAWLGSPIHHEILSNRSYGRIGCAEAVDGDTRWLACVLASGPLPVGSGTASATASGTASGTPGTASGSAPTFALPDTSVARSPATAKFRHALLQPI